MQSDSMSSNDSGARAINIASVGHAVFAATMIAVGLAGVIEGKFTPTWYGVPKGFPARQAIAYLCGGVSLLCGLGLFWRRAALVASKVLLASLLLWLLLVRVSRIVAAPKALGNWWDCGDTAIMAAGAWVLYVWFAGDRSGQRLSFATGDKGLRIARVLFGLAMIPFGIAHFTMLEHTAELVPGWLPWHVAWAYLTGVAFLAAGVAVLTGICARLAVTLTTLQMGLFALLVWVPVVVAGPSVFQWSEFLDSWMLTTGAWVVADSYRKMPWLGVGQT